MSASPKAIDDRADWVLHTYLAIGAAQTDPVTKSWYADQGWSTPKRFLDHVKFQYRMFIEDLDAEREAFGINAFKQHYDGWTAEDFRALLDEIKKRIPNAKGSSAGNAAGRTAKTRKAPAPETRVITAYHGGSEPIRTFDHGKTAMGIFWFSEDPSKIMRGESGAASTRYLMTVKLHVQKTAGWDEYDKLLLDQIFSPSYGFDSIRLDHGDHGDWILRDPKRIEVVKIEERPARGWGRSSGRSRRRSRSLTRALSW